MTVASDGAEPTAPQPERAARKRKKPGGVQRGRDVELVHRAAHSVGDKGTADVLDPSLLDLLEWIAREPRTYADLMAVWRTACPRLTVWEDAIDRGLVTRRLTRGEGAGIELTPLGRVALARSGR
ncbi:MULTISPECIES: hypothetical protein [unclassified Bradyrhizobium]|uniref:hypothetical protein n=1 Tax=unclassified Bradyrhizobium TaxID=2631580 RepID=UPI002011B6A7|nr:MULTISPECIES: hypothetical protein [unclassified Bradyrhizobium]